MDMPSSKSLSDVKVLLEFLRTDESIEPNYEAQVTSLQTLCGMCSDKVVDVLLKIGGLHVIWELCGKTDNPEVCQTCLYALACAVETSNEAKNYLTTKQHFNNIKAILNSDLVPEKTKLCSIYFLLPLLSENVLGQQLMLSSGCLHILLCIYVKRVRVITNSENPQSSYELWLLSSKALKQAVALPQNSMNYLRRFVDLNIYPIQSNLEKNQQECARYIPHMITILHESKGEENIILHSCQVFSAVVANNGIDGKHLSKVCPMMDESVMACELGISHLNQALMILAGCAKDSEYCQDTACNARAVEVFILLLQSWICESRKEEIIGNIVTALSTLIGDNGEYRQRFQKLGGVQILLSLLTSEYVMACEFGISHLNQALTILAGCAKDSGRCRQALCDRNAASAIVRLMNEVDGDEYFAKVTANLLSYCVEKQSNENATEESSQTILSCDPSEQSLSEVQDEPFPQKSEDSCPDIDEGLESSHPRRDAAVPTESVVKAPEQNDRVIAILERQQEQIDLLQKLLIEHFIYERGVYEDPCSQERNLRLVNEEKRRASENNPTIVQDAPNQLSNGSAQRSLSTPSWTKSQSIHNQELPPKTIMPPQIQTDMQLTHDEDWAVPPAETREHHSLRDYPLSKTSPIRDIFGSSSGFFDAESNLRKHNKPIMDTPIKASGPLRGKEPVISSSKNKYYIQSKKSIRQHYCRDITTPRQEPTLCDKFNGAQMHDRDDIISMCSDIVDDEIKRSRIRRSLRRQKGHSMSKKKRHIQTDWDVYSYYGDDLPKAFKRPIPPQDRRQSRKKFEAEEVKNIKDGVKALGMHFRDILHGYQFHPRRSAADLRDKYRNMSNKRCDSVGF